MLYGYYCCCLHDKCFGTVLKVMVAVWDKSNMKKTAGAVAEINIYQSKHTMFDFLHALCSLKASHTVCYHTHWASRLHFQQAGNNLIRCNLC